MTIIHGNETESRAFARVLVRAGARHVVYGVTRTCGDGRRHAFWPSPAAIARNALGAYVFADDAAFDAFARGYVVEFGAGDPIVHAVHRN